MGVCVSLAAIDEFVHLFHYLFLLFFYPFFPFLSLPYHSASGPILEVCLLATLTHTQTHTDRCAYALWQKEGKQRPPQPFEDTFCLMLFINSFWVWHCLITTYKTFALHKWREERKKNREIGREGEGRRRGRQRKGGEEEEGGMKRRIEQNRGGRGRGQCSVYLEWVSKTKRHNWKKKTKKSI